MGYIILKKKNKKKYINEKDVIRKLDQVLIISDDEEKSKKGIIFPFLLDLDNEESLFIFDEQGVIFKEFGRYFLERGYEIVVESINKNINPLLSVSDVNDIEFFLEKFFLVTNQLYLSNLNSEEKIELEKIEKLLLGLVLCITLLVNKYEITSLLLIENLKEFTKLNSDKKYFINMFCSILKEEHVDILENELVSYIIKTCVKLKKYEDNVLFKVSITSLLGRLKKYQREYPEPSKKENFEITKNKFVVFFIYEKKDLLEKTFQMEFFINQFMKENKKDNIVYILKDLEIIDISKGISRIKKDEFSYLLETNDPKNIKQKYKIFNDTKIEYFLGLGNTPRLLINLDGQEIQKSIQENNLSIPKNCFYYTLDKINYIEGELEDYKLNRNYKFTNSYSKKPLLSEREINSSKKKKTISLSPEMYNKVNILSIELKS